MGEFVFLNILHHMHHAETSRLYDPPPAGAAEIVPWMGRVRVAERPVVGLLPRATGRRTADGTDGTGHAAPTTSARCSDRPAQRNVDAINSRKYSDECSWRAVSETHNAYKFTGCCGNDLSNVSLEVPGTQLPAACLSGPAESWRTHTRPGRAPQVQARRSTGSA